MPRVSVNLRLTRFQTRREELQRRLILAEPSDCIPIVILRAAPFADRRIHGVRRQSPRCRQNAVRSFVAKRQLRRMTALGMVAGGPHLDSRFIPLICWVPHFSRSLREVGLFAETLLATGPVLPPRVAPRSGCPSLRDFRGWAFLPPRSRNFLNSHSALRGGDKSNVPPTLFPQSFPQPQYFQIVTYNLD